ncbi:MAG TPA: CoA-binding protein [Smithellaceae bacterium]|nr:CoA-binding protein [Smithellaceae bacterium]HQF84992.1 CoA-binding protein [Smithellaceae bacterium]HQG81513.1 CoA-binding protein [Smithellaceae bacterium]
MAADDFHSFFSPEGVLIVGARRSMGFGFGLPTFLKKHGWGDRTFLVNPSGGEIEGLKAYRRIADVPGPADLAIVIVPADAVPVALTEIAARGIRHVIIESAGFAETDEEGRERQEEAKRLAKRLGLRVIGPNCVGVINMENRFASVELLDEALTPGPLSIIAQSGVFGNILLDFLHQRRIHVAKAITLGNRLDVNECDMLDYLYEDPATRVIAIYLEGAADGKRLHKTLSRVTKKKPVIILKSGKTSEGKRATASHTGSLSGEDEIYNGIFAQTATVRAESLPELIDFAKVFTTQPLPQGNRLGIVTSSGSMGALATDVAVAGGLLVGPLSDTTVKQARAIAPGWMNVKNPLDIGPSGLFNQLTEILINDPQVDMANLIIAVPYSYIKVIKQMGMKLEDAFGALEEVRTRLATPKPFVITVVGHDDFVEEITGIAGNTIPVFTSPEEAAAALAGLWKYTKATGQAK